MNEQPSESQDRRDEPAKGEAEPQRPRESLTVWQVIGSTIAAALGVQSSRNRERDFTRGRAWHFIVAGIIFTVLFVVTIILIVNLVL